MAEPRLQWDRRRRKDGLYYARVRWTDSTGERQQEVLGHVSPAAAEERRAAIEAELRLGLASPRSTSPVAPVTVDDLVVRYLQALEEHGRGTPVYRRHELLFCQRIGQVLGPIPAQHVGESHVRMLIQGAMKEAPAGEGRARLRGIRRKSSITDMVACLRRVFRHGRDLGLVDREIPRLARSSLPDDSRPPRQLTEAEVALLIEAGAEVVGAWFGRLVQFLAWCPRRPVACFGIRVAHTTRVTDQELARAERKLLIERDKGGVGRGWCPLTEPALEALVAQLQSLTDSSPRALVWQSSRGRPLNASLLAPQLARVAGVAGVEDVHLYDLRKFGASTVYSRSQGSLHITQLYTGHRDVRTLFRYLSAPQAAADSAASSIGWKR